MRTIARSIVLGSAATMDPTLSGSPDTPSDESQPVSVRARRKRGVRAFATSILAGILRALCPLTASAAEHKYFQGNVAMNFVAMSAAHSNSTGGRTFVAGSYWDAVHAAYQYGYAFASAVGHSNAVLTFSSRPDVKNGAYWSYNMQVPGTLTVIGYVNY